MLWCARNLCKFIISSKKLMVISFFFRDMNLSKLVDEDEPLFMSLIEDMFPGIKLTSQTYKQLQAGILNATVEMGIINSPEWNLKTIQVENKFPINNFIFVNEI